MVSARKLAALLFLTTFLSILALGQSATPNAKFDDYIHAYVRNGDFSGSILVAKQGHIIFHKSYGMANYELGVPNTERTKFHIASVSKTFTAAAIAVLEKQGKLKLSDPLSKWIPDFLNGEKITVEQMLTHRSGLPDYYGLPDYAAKKSQRVSLPDLIAWVKTKPLDFLPGSETRYSNTGYAFLAYIVEQVSGKSYEEFVREEFFEPAGMKDSGTFRDDVIIPGRASGYQPWTGETGLRNAPPYDKTILTGAASFYSTSGDLYSWCRALQEAKFFDMKKLGHPYGWGERETADAGVKKRKFLEQDGRAPGFASHVAMYGDEDVVVIALSNEEDAAVDAMAGDLAMLAYGAAAHPPAARPKAKLKNASEFAGRYEVRPDFLLDVKEEGGTLLLRGTGGDYLPLEPVGVDTFFDRQLYVPVRFRRSKAGAVDTLIWKGDYPCPKVADKPAN
jgi:CubicO group peptidase (beta-lactamase class C family)